MSNLANNTIELRAILEILGVKSGAAGGAANTNWGTFTMDAKTAMNTVPIEHGLGATPDLVICICTGGPTWPLKPANGAAMWIMNIPDLRRYNLSGSDYQSTILPEETLADWANDTTFTLNYQWLYYAAGYEYTWVAVKK